MAYIYQIKNDINDKIYVGKTTLPTIEERFRQHLTDYKKETEKIRPLYRAMNKYGAEHFFVELLEECSFKELEDKEVYQINKLDTYHNGYNATRGGDGKTLYDYDEIIEKYENGLSVKEISKETGACVDIIYNILTTNGFDLVKNAQQKTRKTQGKSCYQIDIKTQKILNTFETLTDAGRYICGMKLSSSSPVKVASKIGKVCNGERITAYGFCWRFTQPYEIKNETVKIGCYDKDNNLIKSFNSIL